MFNYEEKTREDRLEGHTETERVALCAAALMKTICFQTHLLLLLRPQLKHKLTDVAVDVSMPTHAHARTYLYFNTFTKKKKKILGTPSHLLVWPQRGSRNRHTYTLAETHTEKKTQPPSLLACGVNYRSNTLSAQEWECVFVYVCVYTCVLAGSRGAMSGNNKGQFHPNYHPDYHYIKEPFMAFINAKTKQRWCLSPLLCWACAAGVCVCLWL